MNKQELVAHVADAAGITRKQAQAAAKGAQVILLQELFETPYFCKDHWAPHFELARPLAGNPLVTRFQALATELGVVLPLSFFERAGGGASASGPTPPRPHQH
jgi:N-carbamoylputrescine amidase